MRYQSCEPSELIVSSLLTPDLLRNSTPKINIELSKVHVLQLNEAKENVFVDYT